jgi:hypothetical protein
MLPVFAMRDMIDELMTHVDFLPDVLAVRQVSRKIYRWSRAVPDRRRERILRRFFLDSLEHFLTVMGETGTIITGSCALNMLLGNRYDACSSDLHLIVPHEMFFTYFSEIWLDMSLRKNRWNLIHRSPPRSRVSSFIGNRSSPFL